ELFSKDWIACLCGRSGSCAFYDDESDVIVGGSGAREGRKGLFDAVADARCRRGDVLADNGSQAVQSKFFLREVIRLRHSVGIDNKRVSGIKFRITGFVLGEFHDPERQAARLKLLDAAVRTR